MRNEPDKEVANRKRHRWQRVAIGLICAAAVLFFMLSGSFGPSASALYAPLGANSASVNQNARDQSRVIALQPGISGSRHRAAANSAAFEAPYVEVCGYGWQRAIDGPSITIQKYSDSPGEAIVKAATALTQSPIEKKRALGFYLQAANAGWAELEAFSKQYPEWHGDELHTRKYTEISDRYHSSVSPELIKLAETTNDPDVYAMAFHQCQKKKAEGCSNVTAEQWAKLDPDNAVPWLAIAGGAIQRKDATAGDAALEKFASLPKLNSRKPPLADLLQSEQIQSLAPMTKTNVGFSLMATNGSLILYDLGRFGKYCGLDFTTSDKRKEICGLVANRFADQDEDWVTKLMGRNIGERAGWPTSRTSAIQTEFDENQRLWIEEFSDPKMLSCDGLAGLNQRAIDTLKLGEIGAFRKKWLQKSRLNN